MGDTPLCPSLLGGSDYILLDQSVRFPPNSNTSDPIRVQIVDNMLVEPTETFTVMLVIPGPAATSGARGGAITEHTISIEDDDSEYPVEDAHACMYMYAHMYVHIPL